MQNMIDSHLCGRQRTTAFCAMLICLAGVLAALLFVLGAPSVAEAKSYTMPKVDIQAQVETDGSLHVTEQRTFDFNGDFTAVWWDFGGLPANAEVKVSGVRAGAVDADGAIAGEWMPLKDMPFVLDWREAGGPGGWAYSFDSPKNSLYVFMEASDAHLMVEIDYTVVNGVQAYKDVGEVYWQYVTAGWEVPSDDVTMTLALPVPQGTEISAGENVRAWGHGALDGTVSVNADGTITYHSPSVSSGQFAEARVVFPVEWLTNLSGEDKLGIANTNRLDTVVQEESAWADQANRDRMFSLAFIIGCGVICVLLLAWALWAYFKYGREYRPDFTDEYWRDVPDPTIHPAVIGRLWRWDRENSDDFTATLMHLAHIGAVRIDSGSYPDPGIFGTKEVEDYYITRLPAAANVEDPLDRATISLLFDIIAQGRSALWFGTIKKYGKDHPREFVDAMQEWQGALSGATNRQDFFELKGKHYQSYLITMAVVLAVVGFVVALIGENFIPLIFMVPTAIALGVIGNYMPRRSRFGNNTTAKCKALRNWLRDFSSLDERPPTDVKVWGEFMVYAYLFGVADEAIKQLQTTMPELFVYDGSMGMTYMPWWVWYAGTRSSTGVMLPSMGDMLQTSMSNTMTMAQGALSGASGNFSSGSGFGGGFSGFGGGGFGGGGGGGAR